MAARPYLIHNPKAGSYFRQCAAYRVEDLLKTSYPDLVVMPTQKSGDGIRLSREAAQSGSHLIFCAGGDGTYNEVINGAAGFPVSLGFLPMGTGNSLVRELRLPIDPIKACRALISGKPRRVHLGRVRAGGLPNISDKPGRRYFILMVGAGFDAYVVQRVGVRLKNILGKLAFVLGGVWCLLTYRYPTITFRMGEKRLIGTTGIVSKARSYAGSFTIDPQADLEKPTLRLCLFKGRGFLTYLKYGLAVMLGVHGRLRDVEMHTVEEVLISSDEPVPVHADGEWIGLLPAEVSLSDEAISVLYPDRK